MGNNGPFRIAIAETSVIVRRGLTVVLQHLPNIKAQPIELLSAEALHDCLRTQCPEILIVNPSFGGYFDVARFRDQTFEKKIGLVALVTSFVDASLLERYDESVSIFDDLDTLSKKIGRLLDREEDGGEDNQYTLSQREKEIVICIVKGMTNKEIAQKLFLSVHTVITHRRNITRKLRIHSTAGLTIYAIVNKLVALSEVKEL